MAKIYIITGPSGVGKTTVTNALCNKLTKCAILEGDEIYHQVKSGAVKPWMQGNHVQLMWKNIVCLARNYLCEGIDVVINYIITDKELTMLRENLSDFQMHFIVLMANKETIIERDELRPEDEQMHRVEIHLKKFKEYGFDERFILNTEGKSPNEVVDVILKGKFVLN